MFGLTGWVGCDTILGGGRRKRNTFGSKIKCFAVIQLFLECCESSISVTKHKTFAESSAVEGEISVVEYFNIQIT